MFPFYMNDRVLPDDKNDLEVLDQLDSALHTIGGVAKPEKPRPQSRVLNSVVAYQAENGLKQDRTVAPKLEMDDPAKRAEGPTLLSINADLLERQRKAFGKHLPNPRTALPIYSGVGAGQSNRPDDVAKARRGLALVGTYSKKRAQAFDRGELDPHAEDPELTPAILKSQHQLGAKPDGIMQPGGETQERAGRLVQAKLAMELGDDLTSPKPFAPRPNPTIARTHPDTPTRVSVPFGSGMGMNDDETDYRLALAQATDIGQADVLEGGADTSVSSDSVEPDTVDKSSPVPGKVASDHGTSPVSLKPFNGGVVPGGPPDPGDAYRKMTREEKYWLDGITHELFDRSSDQMLKDMGKAGAHFRRKGTETLGFLVRNFGPQADIADMGDGSRMVTEGIARGSFIRSLEGLGQMAGGLAGVAIPGSVGAFRGATDQAVESVEKIWQQIWKRRTRQNKWDMYDPPEGWSGKGAKDGRGNDRSAGKAGASGAGVRHGSSGGERLDMEGRSLTARTVVGRTEAGGTDRPISEKAVDEVAKATTGNTPKADEKRELWGPDSIGEARPVGPTGEMGIFVLKDMPSPIQRRVIKHELGHVIDDLSGGIPLTGLEKELREIYSLGLTGQPWKQTRTGPAKAGYADDGPEVHRAEYMAEAIRFYMTDPTGMKARAPRTAKRIRKWVNDHPELKEIIQFNSVAALLAGTAVLNELESDDDPDNGT